MMRGATDPYRPLAASSSYLTRVGLTLVALLLATALLRGRTAGGTASRHPAAVGAAAAGRTTLVGATFFSSDQDARFKLTVRASRLARASKGAPLPPEPMHLVTLKT